MIMSVKRKGLKGEKENNDYDEEDCFVKIKCQII